jgi:hypothetical protein
MYSSAPSLRCVKYTLLLLIAKVAQPHVFKIAD